jgi:hypothetical protein
MQHDVRSTDLKTLRGALKFEAPQEFAVLWNQETLEDAQKTRQVFRIALL